MTHVQFEDQQVRAFAAQLRLAGARIRPQVKGVVQGKATEVRNKARELVRSQIRPLYLRSYPKEITKAAVNDLVADVGPLKARQGQLGRGIEFGSAKHAPIPHMLPAADLIEPGYVKSLADLLLEPIL